MKMNKIFRNKLNKRSTRLVRGNYKTWLKEIKGGLHEWKGPTAMDWKTEHR